MTTWVPILEGELAARAWAAIDGIARDLAAAPADGEDATLAHGASGAALFFAARARATGDGSSWDAAHAALDRAFAGADDGAPTPYLWNGLTGVAFAAELIDRLAGDGPSAPEGGDPHDDLDAMVLELLGQPPGRVHFELFAGAAGLGVYALERMPRPGAARCLEAVVDALGRAAERGPDGARWFTPNAHLPPSDRAGYPDGYCSLGAAHGAPGLLPVLAGACAWGVAADRAGALLDDGARWLWSHRLPDGGPAFAALEGETEPAPASWCYGEFGAAGALAAAARATGRDRLLDMARELGRRAAAVRPDDERVADPMLCHGAAGLGHICNRLHQTTGDAELLAAARGWLARAMERPARGAGLLEGAAGVGLALLAAVTPVEPIWDRAFGLSVRLRD